MDCSTWGFPVHHQLPELAQTHVHQVGDTIQPSHLLSSPSPAFNLPQSLSLYVCVYVYMWIAWSCPTLRPHGLYSPWDSPGQSTGVGSLCLLQGIFPTQRLNPGLPHCRRILYQLSYQGRKMEYYSAIQKNEMLPFAATWQTWRLSNQVK